MSEMTLNFFWFRGYWLFGHSGYLNIVNGFLSTNLISKSSPQSGIWFYIIIMIYNKIFSCMFFYIWSNFLMDFWTRFRIQFILEKQFTNYIFSFIEYSRCSIKYCHISCQYHQFCTEKNPNIPTHSKHMYKRVLLLIIVLDFC